MTPMQPPPDRNASDIRLSVVEEHLKGLERRLYGNGQPGDIQDMRGALRGIRSSLDDANTKLGRLMVAVAGAGTVTGGGVMYAIQAFMGG